MATHPWGFYGRSAELAHLARILDRNRWFFVKITGRRRIGKTSLIREALQSQPGRKIFYVQIPDSGPAGVLSAVIDAMETFRIGDAFPRPNTLAQLADLVGQLAEAGYVVALDEFQYFVHDKISEFTSFLQAQVDRLSSRAATVPGGLLVLGSIHTEMEKLLEDRNAPLFNRTTDELRLTHLDTASIVALLDDHDAFSASGLLFYWSLFEGVPKFYRDCFEQGVLGKPRQTVLAKLFFESSSPLRTEADNWFLKELRGRYDVVLKYVAKHPGCANGDIEAHARQVSREAEQVAGYVKILIDRYGLIERKLPIFAKPTARSGRYHLTDNFLAAWLAALASPVSALAFRPVEELVAESDRRLADVEGRALEKLVAQLYAERSRRGVGDFKLTSRIQGYWDSSDIEVDMVAIAEDDRVIRFCDCKRSPEKLVANITNFRGHVGRFIAAFPRYASWRQELAGIAPELGPEHRHALETRGIVAQDLGDLCR